MQITPIDTMLEVEHVPSGDLLTLRVTCLVKEWTEWEEAAGVPVARSLSDITELHLEHPEGVEITLEELSINLGQDSDELESQIYKAIDSALVASR